jgi:phenylacetate-CoA ligase
MLLVPDRGRIWPRLPGAEMGKAAPIVQHQIVQRGPGRIVARLVTQRALTGAEEARVVELLHKSLGYPFEVALEYPEQIERSPSGKFEEFRSEI